MSSCTWLSQGLHLDLHGVEFCSLSITDCPQIQRGGHFVVILAEANARVIGSVDQKAPVERCAEYPRVSGNAKERGLLAAAKGTLGSYVASKTKNEITACSRPKGKGFLPATWASVFSIPCLQDSLIRHELHFF